MRLVTTPPERSAIMKVVYNPCHMHWSLLVPSYLLNLQSSYYILSLRGLDLLLFIDHLIRHAPVKRKQIRARPSAPWTTDEIRYAKQKKRRAEWRWRAPKTPSNLALFRSQRNRVTYLMNKARQEYYRSFIDDISNDQRKLFKASKSLPSLYRLSSSG